MDDSRHAHLGIPFELSCQPAGGPRAPAGCLSVFLAFDAVGRVLWTSAYFAIGYAIGGNLEAATDFLTILSVLLLSLTLFVAPGSSHGVEISGRKYRNDKRLIARLTHFVTKNRVPEKLWWNPASLMRTGNGPSAMEIQMKKSVLAIGGIALASMLVGGWALAQSAGHGPAGFGPGRIMMGMGGPMGAGMHGHMGPGMIGMGPGMMGMSHGSATAAEHGDIRDLLFNHDRIKRTVTNLPDGIRTVTESDDPQVAATIKRHVAEMGRRVEEGRDPGLPIETPALHSIFRDKDKIKSAYEVTEQGIIVVQTSTDATAVKALQDHAAEVTDLAKRGIVAAHEAMMKNGGGMMGRGMRGTMAGPQQRH